MNNELLMVFLPGLSWIFFALGGTQISDKIEGKKWLRRFVLPFIYFGFASFVVIWWQALIVCVLATASFHQGYGDKTPWWRKVLVGVSYGAIGLSIGASIWNAITAVMFSILFLLSNFKPTSRTFVWKIVEGLFGALVGIEIAYSLMGNGLTWLVRR